VSTGGARLIGDSAYLWVFAILGFMLVCEVAVYLVVGSTVVMTLVILFVIGVATGIWVGRVVAPIPSSSRMSNHLAKSGLYSSPSILTSIAWKSWP
jgi:protein-S-isoprenylcysteine O-methyltransferase Ste14